MGRKNNSMDISSDNRWSLTLEDMSTKEKPKRETESLQIATQNNAIRTNYYKAKLIIRNRITSVGLMVIGTEQ